MSQVAIAFVTTIVRPSVANTDRRARALRAS